jgi:hypothetical protein
MENDNLPDRRVRSHLAVFGATVASTMLFAGPHSHAAVSTVAWYQMGEDGGDIAKDSSGNGNDLTIGGAPTSVSDTSPLAAGSTLSGNFASTDSLSRPTPVATSTGVALEAWVKTGSANQTATAVYVGNSGADGFGFFQYTTNPSPLVSNWNFLEGGHSFNTTTTPATPGVWTHLGLTIDASGVLRGYINDRRVATDAGSPNPPTGTLSIGGGFTGNVDQVRLMTFTGTFQPSNFLYGSSTATIGYRNSFEASDAGKYFLDTGSTTTGDDAHVGVANNSSGYGVEATDGTQFLSFNGGSLVGNAYLISRPFITGDATGTVSFDFGNWGGGSGEAQTFRIELLDASNDTVYWTWTGDLTDSSPTTGFAMSHYSMAYTSLANVSLLRITDLSGNAAASDGLFDNIIVTAPEPTAGILLAAASMILPARRRCRRR